MIVLMSTKYYNQKHDTSTTLPEMLAPETKRKQRLSKKTEKNQHSRVESHVRLELRAAHSVGLAALALDGDGQERVHHGVERRLVPVYEHHHHHRRRRMSETNAKGDGHVHATGTVEELKRRR